MKVLRAPLLAAVLAAVIVYPTVAAVASPPVREVGTAPSASSAAFIAAGAGTDLVQDVTGYYLDDDSGATFVPMDPVRLLDTRSGNGLSGMFASGIPRSVQIAGRGDVPDDAVAVTINVTVTAQTSPGYVAVGPSIGASPSTSTLNFPRGDNRANGTTAALASDGKLSAVFKGSSGAKTHLFCQVRSSKSRHVTSPRLPVALASLLFVSSLELRSYLGHR
jgi:hypothetical protein